MTEMRLESVALKLISIEKKQAEIYMVTPPFGRRRALAMRTQKEAEAM